MAKSTFASFRKAVAKHDREALLSLIGELYAISEQNRDFLNARFLSDESGLTRYRNIIREALYPERSDSVSFRDARKAISDYRKALGHTVGLAELLVYAAECGNRYTCEYGDIDGPFYDSLCRMFESAVKTVVMLDEAIAQSFVSRLRDIVGKADGIGWGYFDAIAACLAGSFPDDR